MNGDVRRPASLAAGFRSLRQWRLILLLLITTVALALPAAFVLWPALRSVFAGTLVGDHVLRNDPSLAPEDVFEFLHEKWDAVAGARQAAIAAGILGVLLQIFFAGGFVETLGSETRVRLGDFCAASFRNLWHNLKCFAIFLAVAGIALGFWLGGTGAAARKIFERTPPGSLRAFLFHVGVGVFAFLIYAVLSLLHDFARMARRYEPAIGAWRGYRFAKRLLAGSWLAGLGLFLFWFVTGATGWFLLLAIEWGTSAVSAAAILLHTLLQLSAATVRCSVRVAAWGSYVALADGRAASREPRAESASPAAIPEPLPPVDLIGEAP